MHGCRVRSGPLDPLAELALTAGIQTVVVVFAVTARYILYLAVWRRTVGVVVLRGGVVI